METADVKTRDKNYSTFDYSYYGFNNEISEEEKRKRIIIEEKIISKMVCKDKNINVNLFALEELEKIGFKKEISTIIMSQLIENVYHERKAFDASDYFDLSLSDNEHYTELVDYFKIGNESTYRGLIAKAICDSNSESKNINDIVYGIAERISKKIDKSLIKELQA